MTDRACRVKYARYGPTHLPPMVADAARATTVEITRASPIGQ
jgi:hypothetical protein